jgi:endonuclease-3
MERVAAQTGDPFAVLVGTVLSLRTRDETTLAAFQRLHRLAAHPAALAALPEAVIARTIHPVAFFRVKAGQLRAQARLLLERHGGQVPAELEALLALPGVGRKTANLVLGLGFGQPAVCVDTHVHRILNRLGALRSRQPDETEALLRAHLPRRWWLRVNALLVPFGQARCTPLSPRCTGCPAAQACGRLGVGRHR